MIATHHYSLPLLAASLLAASLALPTPAAQACEPGPCQGLSPRADKKPTIPRYQGPYAPGGDDDALQEVWGFALAGSGAVLGGLGFYALDTNTTEVCTGSGADRTCAEHDRGRTQIGATLLISGIFLTGVGVYLVANADSQPRIIILDDLSPESSFGQITVDPVDGGGIVRSRFSF